MPRQLRNNPNLFPKTALTWSFLIGGASKSKDGLERKTKQLSGSSIHAYLCNWTHVKKHIPVSQNLRICIIRFPRPVYHLESEADREFSFTSVTKALGTDNELITTIKSSKEIGDENILQMLKPIPPPTHTFQRLVALPILRSTDRLLRNICPT